MKKIHQYAFTLAVLWVGATPSVAQLPNTQIYCFEIDRVGEQIDFKNCKYLTGFNPFGYNNQPQWLNNNELYISAMTPYDTTQTEIYSLSLLSNILQPVTSTREAEYSPTMMPDRKHFSVIRTDAVPPFVQRLWAYPLDRSNSGRDLLPLHTNVGYHCWLTDKKVALFIVDGNSNYLKIVNTDDQSSVQLTNGIGRSFARTNDGKLLFVQKATPDTWYIKSLDPINYSSAIIIQTLPGSEDFALMPDGTLVMGNGSRIFTYKIGNVLKEWAPIADLSKFGVTNIRRLALSRESDKIALVNDMPRR